MLSGITEFHCFDHVRHIVNLYSYYIIMLLFLVQATTQVTFRVHSRA